MVRSHLGSPRDQSSLLRPGSRSGFRARLLRLSGAMTAHAARTRFTIFNGAAAVCEFIPIGMGTLPRDVRRVALRAYQDAIEAAAAAGDVTITLRNDIAFIVIETALNGDHDYGELKTAALRYAAIAGKRPAAWWK